MADQTHSRVTLFNCCFLITFDFCASTRASSQHNDNEDHDPLAAVNAIIATFNSAVEDDLADRAFEDDLAEFAATDSDSDDGSESTGSYMYDSDGKGFF